MHDHKLSDSPPFSFLVERSLEFECSCDHQAGSTPQISLIVSSSATSATTGMIFIGLLSHMTHLETVPFNQPLVISIRRFSDVLLSQTFVNQPVRLETKYPRSVDYRQSLCAFIVSQIIRK